jgi:hypothetical protein
VSTQVKNLVHAAGALVGVAIGFGDGALLRGARSRWSAVAGGAAAVAILGSFWALAQGNVRDRAARDHDLGLVRALEQEAVGLVTSERLYLRLASAPGSRRRWEARNLQERSTLARLVKRLGVLEGRTALMGTDAVREEWLGLMRGVFLGRPHPGEIARMRALNGRLVGTATLRLDEGRRVLATWVGRLELEPGVRPGRGAR